MYGVMDMGGQVLDLCMVKILVEIVPGNSSLNQKKRYVHGNEKRVVSHKSVCSRMKITSEMFQKKGLISLNVQDKW